MFIYFSIVADLYYSVQLFKELASNKSNIEYLLNVYKVVNQNPSSVNPLCECINFKQIPSEKRFFVKEVEEQMKEVPPTLEEIRKALFKFFNDLSKTHGKNYHKMKLAELLEESYKQLIDGSIWNYFTYIIEKTYTLNIKQLTLNTYLKYLAEYAIMLYEMSFVEPKILENAFYEINDMYNDDKSNSILISTKNKKEGEDISDSLTFSSFLREGFEKIKHKIKPLENQGNKNQIKEHHFMFILHYNTLIEEAKKNKK